MDIWANSETVRWEQKYGHHRTENVALFLFKKTKQLTEETTKHGYTVSV